MAKDRSLVRASDIGAWAFCHRAWWLANVRKTAHANPAQLVAGTNVHQQHGQQVRRSMQWRRAGMILIAGSILATFLLLLLMWLL